MREEKYQIIGEEKKRDEIINTIMQRQDMEKYLSPWNRIFINNLQLQEVDHAFQFAYERDCSTKSCR